MNVDRCPPSDADDLIGEDDIAVVVDALRASVTVISLLDSGAIGVEPVTEVPQSREDSPILVGEDHGERIEGFDFGNSPLEIQNDSDRIEDEYVVLRTTNGTRCVELVDNARHVMMGSLVNLDAVIKACERLSENGTVWFVPAGRHGDYAPEDDYTVSKYISRIKKRNDAVDTERNIVDKRRFDDDEQELFRKSDTGRFLRKKGKGDDVIFCSQTNTFDVSPLLNEGVFVAAETYED